MTFPPSIHHVMVAVPPYGETLARAFYIDALGLTEIPKPGSLVGRGGFWVSTGSIDLHIGIDQRFAPARKAHVALLVSGLDALRKQLQQSDFAPGPIEFELPGFQRCYVDDPFGNRIELMESL